jgi:RHS repeat-associated protein
VGTNNPPSTPTHNGSNPGTGTSVYSGPVNVAIGAEKFFNAIAYKSGLGDSDMTDYDADNTGGGGMSPQMGPMSASSSSTTTIFSVWDGDWAILEEYDSTGARVQGYVEGYHGLVKTLVDNIYYYQDELGSTSHIADASGALLEYYKYDLYGKPTYFDSTSQPLNSSTYGVMDLFTGQRWHSELGLYDDRNRFMSPDLGRFLQPDPIGFKGDASNLYRYCGNDWANRTDPMGTEATPQPPMQASELQSKEISSALRDWNAGSMMWDFEKRADTSGGNGSRDGRATPDASKTDAKPVAIGRPILLASIGLGQIIPSLPAGLPHHDPFDGEPSKEDGGVAVKNLKFLGRELHKLFFPGGNADPANPYGAKYAPPRGSDLPAASGKPIPTALPCPVDPAARRPSNAPANLPTLRLRPLIDPKTNRIPEYIEAAPPPGG